MRFGLATLLLAALAACPASHGRRGRDRKADDASLSSLEPDGDVEGDDDGEVVPRAPDAALDDASMEGGSLSDTDAAAVDAASADAAIFRAEIVAPRPATEFYTFEDVELDGVCHSAPGQGPLEARFEAHGPIPTWYAHGASLNHRFDFPGSYTVTLICRDGSGAEQRATLDLRVHDTPRIAYAAIAPGAASEAVFATRLDQLGETYQVSPKSEALAAQLYAAQYSPASDRVLVRGELFDKGEQVLATLIPCRGNACVGQEITYQALVPEAHACKPGSATWSPDGRSIYVSYSCASGPAGATSYWVDLSGTAPVAHPLERSAGHADFDGTGDFSAGGDVLVYQTGIELKAMDTRAADHPVVSLGSVDNARWLLSAARDRVLVLGDKGYTLSASELMAQGAGARREFPYGQGAPRLFRPGQTHLVYMLERRAQNGQPYWESRLMRWDGSRDTQLCSNCIVDRCGDRILVPVTTEPSHVVRIAEGATSDVAERIPLPQGAPEALGQPGFDSQCTLVLYASNDPPHKSILWDTTTGEWLEAPGDSLSPDGRHMMAMTNIWPIERAPLVIGSPVTTFTAQADRGAFSPDGKHYVWNDELSAGDGFYHLDLETYRIDRLAEPAYRLGFSDDMKRVLVRADGQFDQRVAEYDLSTRAQQWRSQRGTADWGSLYIYWDPLVVPGARVLAYRGKLSADGVMSVYRSDLDKGETQHFAGGVSDNWALSSDGSLLGTGAWNELKLWSFDAQGAAAPLAQKALERPMSCLTFEVSSDGLLCVGRGVGQMYWLDAKSGGVGELTLPRTTETYWEGTRGPEGSTRGMLFYITDDNASTTPSWLDFSTPTTLRLESGTEPPRWSMLTQDRRYFLRDGPSRVTDLATGETRSLVKANDTVSIPVPYKYYEHLETKGRMVLSNDYMLYWVDLEAAVVTASSVVGPVLRLSALGSNLSRVLLLDEAKRWLAVIDESGQRTTLYKDDSVALRDARPSPDGRWVLYSTEDASFVVPTDGSSPAKRLPSRVDGAMFDRTGRFLLGELAVQPGVVDKALLKVWKLDAPGSSTLVSPAEFAPFGSWSARWLQ
jgi:hypothetical protein